jgi:hypothetical protein
VDLCQVAPVEDLFVTRRQPQIAFTAARPV